MKFIIAPVYTVYERSVHPHYPQGFPQVLGSKTPEWQGFPRLFTPCLRELSYIFHRLRFLFITQMEKTVCFMTMLRRILAQFCQNRRFPSLLYRLEGVKRGENDCKSRGIFYKCIAFSDMRFIHFSAPRKPTPFHRRKNAAARVQANMRSDGKAFRSSAATSPRIRR